MSRLHIQVEAPKYEDTRLPARCTAEVHGVSTTVVLWESYINHRTSEVVYLASYAGRYLMLPESAIKEGTVSKIPHGEEATCKTTMS